MPLYRLSARWHAEQGSSGVTDPAEIDKLCAEGRDAAKFLTQYVVQAELNDRGNYGVRSCPAKVPRLRAFDSSWFLWQEFPWILALS